MRPKSILWFERLFLAVIVVTTINSVLVYQSLTEATDGAGSGFMIGSLAVGVLINVALWYFIARRGSNAARWVLTVLFALGVASLAFSIMVGSYPQGLAGALGAIGWVLQAAALFCLFRPDAAAWFRGYSDDDLDETFQ